MPDGHPRSLGRQQFTGPRISPYRLAGLDPETFYAIPIVDMLVFATLIVFATAPDSIPPPTNA